MNIPDRVDTLLEQGLAIAKDIDSVLHQAPSIKRILDISRMLSNINERLAELNILWKLDPDSKRQKLAKDARRKLSVTLNQIYYTQHTYQYYSQVMADTSQINTPVRKHYMQQELLKMKHAGLHLSSKQLEKVVKLENQIGQSIRDFTQLVDNDDWVMEFTTEEVGEMDLDEFVEDGKVVVDAFNASVFVSECPIASLRQKVYAQSNGVGHPKNLDKLRQLIKLRTEMAQMVGHKNYAEMQMSTMMVTQPEQIRKFLRSLWDKLFDKAKNEVKLVQQEFDLDSPIRYCDFLYYKRLYQIKHYDLDINDIEFKLPVALPVVLKQYSQLLGVTFKSKQVKLWVENLTEITVSLDKEVLGKIVCDWFPRKGKSDGFSCYGVRTGQNDGLAVLNCNFPKDLDLSFYHLKSLFHEFGHALHHLLGESEFHTLAGFETTIDFVEMPSQIMENWVWKPKILKRLTKGKLSDDQISNLLELRTLFSGTNTLIQICYALTSLNIYDQARDPLRSTSIYFNSFDTGLMMDVDDFNIESNFIHLMHYGASYYSYLWSRVFAYDVYDQLPERGHEYRDQILKMGGSTSPMMYLVKFLGRPPSIDAFLKELVHRDIPQGKK